jgi:hypothetical protein
VFHSGDKKGGKLRGVSIRRRARFKSSTIQAGELMIAPRMPRTAVGWLLRLAGAISPDPNSKTPRNLTV